MTKYTQEVLGAVYLDVYSAASKLKKSHQGVGEQENKLERNMK